MTILLSSHTMSISVNICIFAGDFLKFTAQPQVPPVIQNNNHQPSFKRKINLESAAAKENNARTTSRPASAQPKISTENSKLMKYSFLYKTKAIEFLYQESQFFSFNFNKYFIYELRHVEALQTSDQHLPTNVCNKNPKNLLSIKFLFALTFSKKKIN